MQVHISILSYITCHVSYFISICIRYIYIYLFLLPMRFLPRNPKKDIGRVFFHCESRDRSGPVYGRGISSQGVPVEMQVVKPQKLPILRCQFKHA